jgi:hypothetical protein
MITVILMHALEEISLKIGAMGAVSDESLCIETSRGCVVSNLTFPYGTILYHFRNLLPDQTNTIETLAQDRHVLLIGPHTPYLPLYLSQTNVKSLTVLHHIREQVYHIQQTFQENRIEAITINAFLSFSDSEVAVVPKVQETFSLLDFFSRHQSAQGTVKVPSIGIARATQGRTPLLLVVQDAHSMPQAVEVAVSACMYDREAVLVVGLPYDLEGAVFAPEQLLALRHLARLDPAAPHLDLHPRPASIAGRACFWHLSDLYGPEPTGPGVDPPEGLGVLGPWADLVCLPAGLAGLAPPDTRLHPALPRASLQGEPALLYEPALLQELALFHEPARSLAQ